jgi:hypothetical protein
MILSILIPTTPDREKCLYELLSELHSQMEKLNAEGEVEILVEIDNKKLSIGSKRQMLLERAIGFSGFMTTDGRKRENFKISKDLPYVTIQDAFGNKEHLRFNNHLSPIRKDVALKIGFKDMAFGEDYDYAKRLKESGLIKTEIYINEDLYHYKYLSKK